MFVWSQELSPKEHEFQLLPANRFLHILMPTFILLCPQFSLSLPSCLSYLNSYCQNGEARLSNHSELNQKLDLLPFHWLLSTTAHLHLMYTSLHIDAGLVYLFSFCLSLGEKVSSN